MEKKKGKYQAVHSRKQYNVLLIVLIALCILSLIVVGKVLLNKAKERNQFNELAAAVQEKETETTVQSTTEETAVQETEETTAPTEAEPQILSQYVSLYEQNADLFGWIKIEGTIIDYPVMYTPDDAEKYLHLGFDGEYSYSGVPFVEANCDVDSDNLIIYGHNMNTDGTIFHQLMKYQQKNFWQEHPTITFNTLYEEQEYEVLAAFYDRVYYKTETCFKFYQFIDAEDEADFDDAISQFKAKALYDTGVEASYGDKLITLVTCAYHTDNGRFVVVARRK